MTQKRIEQLITQLAGDLHLPPPKSQDEFEYFLLEISEKIRIFIKPMEAGFFITAPITSIPKQKEEDTLLYVANANFLRQGTGGYLIGIDNEEKFLTLCHTIPYEMNYKNFKELIEDFANYLVYWKEEMQKLEKTIQEGIL